MQVEYETYRFTIDDSAGGLQLAQQHLLGVGSLSTHFRTGRRCWRQRTTPPLFGFVPGGSRYCGSEGVQFRVHTRSSGIGEVFDPGFWTPPPPKRWIIHPHPLELLI